MPDCFRCGTDASVGKVAIWDLPRWIWVWNALDQWEETNEEWERQPEAMWDRPGLSIEACDIYCRNCWEEWGQHVKPGCKFALNRVCEELAVQAGIEFVRNRRANPFYCPPCARYFNHGESSLERHLEESHGVPLKHSNCLKNLMPPLYISSYHDGRIKGKYVARCWHHDKPLYQKADGFGKVLIYFWDHRDGEAFQGWWLTFGKLGDFACNAYNPSFSLDVLTPPAHGWRVPWCGTKIDPTLTITQQAKDEQKESEFRLRWEFQSSSLGETDWQPMKKAMNDALEKRWEQGWHGDNGSNTFYVHVGHWKYGIDCHAMEQWNAKTLRRRPIRRGDGRPDTSDVTAQLSEKNAQVEWLQTERDNLVEEKNKLQKLQDTILEENLKLTAKVTKLRSFVCKQA